MTDPRPGGLPSGPDDHAQACDVLVVGGGINGAGIAGIARDLRRPRLARGVGRTRRSRRPHIVSLDQADPRRVALPGVLRVFAGAQVTTQEREVLLKSAPHIMWPLRFVMPHDPSMRPAWMIRLGLFLYDHLARREMLPGSEGVNLRSHPLGAPLHHRFTRGFVYSDEWVDDARLVVLNALDAQTHGAQILARTRCTARSATHKGGRRPCARPAKMLHCTRDYEKAQEHPKSYCCFPLLYFFGKVVPIMES